VPFYPLSNEGNWPNLLFHVKALSTGTINVTFSSGDQPWTRYCYNTGTAAQLKTGTSSLHVARSQAWLKLRFHPVTRLLGEDPKATRDPAGVTSTIRTARISTVSALVVASSSIHNLIKGRGREERIRIPKAGSKCPVAYVRSIVRSGRDRRSH
jgi:hypothetical protein